MLKYFGLHPSPTANHQQGLEKNEKYTGFVIDYNAKVKT